jgi:hypothetical protein
VWQRRLSRPVCRGRPLPPADAVIGPKTKGTGCGVLLFDFIPISVNDRVGRAYKQATDGGRALGLTNTTVNERWYWIYIGTLLCTDVEGDAVRAASATPAP